MRVYIAQISSSVGDLNANLRKVKKAVQTGAAQGAQLVVFPEMFLTGYPPRDLLKQHWFAKKLEEAVESLVALSGGFPQVGIVCGLPTPAPGGRWHNSAALLYGGKLHAVQHKIVLSDDPACDEYGYFVPGEGVQVIPFAGEQLVIGIGERDLAELAGTGATLAVNISASPFYLGKPKLRRDMVEETWARIGAPLVLVNSVGGQDELVFDGNSLFCDKNGRLAVMDAFEEVCIMIDTHAPALPSADKLESEAAWIYAALKRGFQDYLAAIGQSRVILGLSGGLDSAVVCALAADVLGPENVRGILMPGPYSTPGSITDAKALAEKLGVKYHVIPISGIYENYREALQEILRVGSPDVTEENIQARIRGQILMAFSNKLGGMVLATSNKSEAAVGYCTMYGDMVGGLAPLADVYKTQVYQLAEYINRTDEIIPLSTITKPPSAELRPDQKDEDSLPPYQILDPIISAYVEEGLSIAEIAARGFDQETVAWVVNTINRMEFKRRQAAPLIRVTKVPFGAGRRMPLAAKYLV